MCWVGDGTTRSLLSSLLSSLYREQGLLETVSVRISQQKVNVLMLTQELLFNTFAKKVLIFNFLFLHLFETELLNSYFNRIYYIRL